MPHINGCKYSCEPCIRGHRATSCAHTDRILIEVRKPGRPLESCDHNLATCKCGRLADTIQIEEPLSDLKASSDGTGLRLLGVRLPLPGAKCGSKAKSLSKPRLRSQSRVLKKPRTSRIDRSDSSSTEMADSNVLPEVLNKPRGSQETLPRPQNHADQMSSPDHFGTAPQQRPKPRSSGFSIASLLHPYSPQNHDATLLSASNQGLENSSHNKSMNGLHSRESEILTTHAETHAYCGPPSTEVSSRIKDLSLMSPNFGSRNKCQSPQAHDISITRQQYITIPQGMWWKSST